MKITDVKTFVVGNPPPGWGGRYFIFLKLTADNGISGYGEVYNATCGPKVMAAMVEDICERHVIGSDPFKIEKMWRQIYGAGFSMRPDITLMGAVSGIEMACWDIVGKALNKPVYELMGGQVHEKLRSYTYLYPEDHDEADVYFDPDTAAERAVEYVKEGFTAVKFDPAYPYTVYDGRQPSQEIQERALTYVGRLREAVGYDADLLCGTHGQFTPSGAIRFAKQIEQFDPLWFEEPCPPEMPEEMARVARATSIPIATGERLCTKYEYARVLQQGAASILQFDLGRVGGLLEAKKIASLAEVHYAQIAPHLYCGPIAGAANIQIAACSPNFLILESIRKWDGFHADLLKTPVQWEEGYVIPSSEPGLGVELNEEVAEAHPYTGTELHLMPTEEPTR